MRLLCVVKLNLAVYQEFLKYLDAIVPVIKDPLYVDCCCSILIHISLLPKCFFLDILTRHVLLKRGHNELSPSIPRKNWLPLPFGGPHCLWASPLVLQMQRKNVKKSVEKKIKCIFWCGSWIRTCDPIKVGVLADRSLSYHGHEVI